MADAEVAILGVDLAMVVAADVEAMADEELYGVISHEADVHTIQYIDEDEASHQHIEEHTVEPIAHLEQGDTDKNGLS